MRKKASVYAIGTVNPKTGRSDDLVETARHAVEILVTKCKEDSCGRYIGVFSITKTLEDAGFKTSVAHFVLFLKNIGLARKLKSGGGGRTTSKYKYLVLDPKYFDLLVTEESVNSVLKQMKKHQDLQKSIIKINKGKSTKTYNGLKDEDFDAINQDLAKVVVRVQELEEENRKLQEECAILKNQPKASPRDVARELLLLASKK